MLTPAEMRALTAMAIKRSETSGQWLDFAHKSLPVSGMTPAEQQTLLTELLFKGPKAAFEFVSENRRYLEPAEVNEVTRDYTRTITTDLCLHLSHRNQQPEDGVFQRGPAANLSRLRGIKIAPACCGRARRCERFCRVDDQ